MNSALSTELKSQQIGRAKGQHVIIFHCQVEICIAVSCRFSLLLLSFLPPVRAPVLCGRLPHTAPLVLPARPRADKTTLLLSRHPHTFCLVGEFAAGAICFTLLKGLVEFR